MQISAVGLASIEASEGWSSGPYLDKVASPPVWTAYFGETKNVGPYSPKITRAEGERRLAKRFADDYAWALEPFVKLAGFTQNMYDALASFVWNCGTGAVSAASAVGRALRKRRWHHATVGMMLWVKNGAGRVIPGLVSRRKREVKLFLTTALDVLAGYPSDERRWIRELDELRHVEGAEARRRTLRVVMTRRRKAIWTLAQPKPKGDGHGFDAHRRRARYRSLHARTT